MCLAGLRAIFAAATALTCLAIPEEPAIRSYFYVGGQYVVDPRKEGHHVFRDQMYVEKLLPVDGVSQDAPVVLIHGQAQTGTNFLIKPDGGRGWASDFLRQGYEVYIVDQTLRGRSAWHLESPRSGTFSAEQIQQRFTATRDYGLWPQAVNHTQWPGSGIMGDAIFDAFYSASVHFADDAVYQQMTVQKAGAALLDKIGRPVILFGHSQGGVMPILIADARPELVKALVLLEPQGPPFRNAVFENRPARAWGLADISIQYWPPIKTGPEELVQRVYEDGQWDHNNLSDCILQAEDPSPRQLINLIDKPILLVTGEASYHAVYDHCTVKYLQQAGCTKTQDLQLGSAGIHGNGHMFFLEKNSQAIQKRIHEWIKG